MPVSKQRKLKRYPKVDINEEVEPTVRGEMSEPPKWIRENMKNRTSKKTLEIQESKQVASKAFVVWDSSQGAYRNGENRKEYKRLRLAEKKMNARKKRLDKGV